MRCRDGITSLSEKFSRGEGVKLLPPHEKRELVARCRKMSSHDAWVYAQREGDPSKAAVMWREAGVKHAIEGRIDEARPMLETALRMLDGAGELNARKSLHALFIKEARRPKDGSRALANELAELAAELIELVDREEAFRLRGEVAQHHRVMQHFEEAAHHSRHMALVLKKEDPARAEELLRAAITDLRDAIKKHEQFYNKPDAELEADLGKAVSLLARLLEARGSPEAVSAYEEAGDHFLAGRKSYLELEDDMLDWAKICYMNAKRLGGDESLLDGKIAACEPEKMVGIVLTPAQARTFMDKLELGKRTGVIRAFASTDDEEEI